MFECYFCSQTDELPRIVTLEDVSLNIMIWYSIQSMAFLRNAIFTEPFGMGS